MNEWGTKYIYSIYFFTSIPFSRVRFSSCVVDSTVLSLCQYVLCESLAWRRMYCISANHITALPIKHTSSASWGRLPPERFLVHLGCNQTVTPGDDDAPADCRAREGMPLLVHRRQWLSPLIISIHGQRLTRRRDRTIIIPTS
jgi:hypothetical protein